MATKLKLAEGIQKPLVINSDYSRKTDVKLTKDGTKNGKQLFFGIKKNNRIDNDLGDKYYDWLIPDPQINDCSGQLIRSSYNNGRQIVYSLSENTTGSARLITFNYKGTTLFKIRQDAGITDDNIYVYFRKWKVKYVVYKYVVCTRNDIDGLTNYYFTNINSIENTFINTNTSTDIVLYHVTNNKDISNIFLNKTIKTLISNNTLTYVSGKKFTDDENELIKAPIKMIKNDQLQLEDVTDNSKMYVYSGIEDATKGDQIDFSFLNDNLYNTIDWSNVVERAGDITAVGKYRYNLNTVNKKTYTIYLYKVETSPFTGENTALSLDYPVYLFVSLDENKTVMYKESDSSYNYKTIDCESTTNKNYTYFLLDTSHTLEASNFNHKTISDLRNNYNLTYESGTKLSSEDNDIIVNNISDRGIVNVWNNDAKGQFGYSQINTQRVISVCLYNFKRELVIERSQYYPKDVLEYSAPYAIYKIDV